MRLTRQHPPLCPIWVAVFVILTAAGMWLGCREQREAYFQAQRVSEGEQLMEEHCSTCHLPVPVASLDRETWLDEVLPTMAPKLGIDVLWGDQYYTNENASSDTSLTLSDWQKIVDYFRSEAPDTIRVPDPPDALQSDGAVFSVRKPRVEPIRRPAATTLVAVDSSTQHIYSSDATAAAIYRWDEHMEPSRIGPSGLIGVDLRFVEDTTGARRGVFTSIGTMRAENVANGEVWNVSLVGDSNRVIAEALPRPVCALPGDYNKDGRRDWVVCGFGHDIGGLYLFEQQPDRAFEQKVIRGVPGAVDAQTGDFNDDGWLDVMVLFGHGDEGVWLFTNDQAGGFTGRNLLRFPPVYGSSSFQVVDINRDGAPDLLYTSGDNADYSPILKPYHGIYLFINQGDFQYEKAYFYHLNGATKAIAADFDDDGDLDIAAIAFFADLVETSAANFVYLEQDGALAFTPHAPPIQHYGRWISMDAGDVDGDADLDLVLGNYARRYATRPDGAVADSSTHHLPFIVLENGAR